MKAKGYTKMRKLGLQDFIDRLEKRGDCLEYVGPRWGGYGQHGRGNKAHRYSYSTFVGEIPEGMVVMHTCDNPPCVLPAHLRLGTQEENNADRSAKGRSYQLEKCGVCGGPWDYYDEKNKQNVCKHCNKMKTRRYRERKNNNG